MTDKLTGSCLCGTVQYIVNGPIKAVANCHCNNCQKTTGSVFATIAVIGQDDLEVTQGQDNLANYKVSEKATKYFCRTCGTPIFNLHSRYPGNYMTQVGSLNDPSLVSPAINIFCHNMSPWVQNIADLRCFDREPTK